MTTGVELATAWIRLVPSADGIQGELSKSLEPEAEAAGEKAGKSAGKKFSAGMKVAALAGGAALAAGLVKVFNVGMDELKFGETINAQTDQLVANTGFALSTDQINNFTLALSKISGISEEDLQAAGNNILKFGDVSKKTYQRAVDAINNMGAAGKDVAGTSEALGKALADPANAAGLLKRQGVILTDQQKEQIDTMTAAGDVAGAQALILGSLEETYGGMAEAAGGTLQGNLNKLNNAFENLSGDLVSTMMPAIEGLVTILQGFVSWLSENQQLVMVFVGILGFLALAFVGVTIATWAMNTALLANPITWIIIAIVAAIAILVAGIFWLVANWDAVWAWISATFEGFMSWIGQVINGFVGWWNGIWGAVGKFIGDVWNNIVNWVSQAINNVRSVLLAVGMAILNWWNGLWTGVFNFVRDAWNNILNVINTIQGAFRTVFNTVANIVKGAFEGVVGVVKGVINSIIGAVNTVIRGINSVAGAIGAAVGMDIHINTIPGLYKGGTITRGGSVLVGERGPELLNLPAGASVNPDISGAGMPDYVTLVDEEGAILGRMKVEAGKVVDDHARDTTVDLSTGRRRL